MKVIIVGAGKVGFGIAENLEKEGIDLVVVDNQPQALKKVKDKLDVMCIKGHGFNSDVLKDSGTDKADFFIAVTDSDEINMICCLVAKKYGAKKTIARVRNPEYSEELSVLKAGLDIDIIINPEQAAANEIAKLFYFTPASHLEHLADGKVRLVNFTITSDSNIIDKSIENIEVINNHKILIGIIVRNGEVIVPNGKTIIHENDEIYIVGKKDNVFEFCNDVGKYHNKTQNVMILGGGKISYYLSKLLDKMGIRVKIVEIDTERCEELSENLSKTLIINADGTDEEVLVAEGMENMDAFIALTGMDEENLLSSLLAKRMGVKKVITKMSRMNYNLNIVKQLGIESVICPKQIVTNQILKYARGGNFKSLYRIIEGQAEIFEFVASENDKYLDVPLNKMDLPKSFIIAIIVRGNEVIIPYGSDVIKAGDRIIVIAKSDEFNSVKNRFVNTLVRRK
jgi:trk system potassium uptake protein TrkA